MRTLRCLLFRDLTEGLSPGERLSTGHSEELLQKVLAKDFKKKHNVRVVSQSFVGIEMKELQPQETASWMAI